ncbi:MAG: VOC family protein [Acidobacteriota bacterium]|nr:VOC family protein [Acidobacteriota bacterium]
MKRLHATLAGVELYFDDLERARKFYREVLGLKLQDEQPGHHSQFDTGASFLCLERKAAESYASRDKAVVFLEVDDLAAAVKKIGRKRFVHIESRGKRGGPSWAVMHDPEGHNVLLLNSRKPKRRR